MRDRSDDPSHQKYKVYQMIINRLPSILVGAGRSSEVERSLMVRWVVGSILHGEEPYV